jgi:hypothetical protein
MVCTAGHTYRLIRSGQALSIDPTSALVNLLIITNLYISVLASLLHDRKPSPEIDGSHLRSDLLLLVTYYYECVVRTSGQIYYY